MKSISELLNSTTSEIHQLARTPNIDKDILIYAKILSYYYEGDLERLYILKDSNDLTIQLQEFLNIRILLRERAIKEMHLIKFLKAEVEDQYLGEKKFLLAMGYEILDMHTLATKYYQEAYLNYKEQGCYKKSARSYYNSIASESREFPHKSFISTYQSVIELVKNEDDELFKGMVETCLSREYQVAGQIPNALDYAINGFNKLKPEKGTIHYYHSCLHLAHLYLQLEQFEKVQDLLNEAKLSTHKEIIAARSLILCSLDQTKTWDRTKEKDLLPTWKERVSELTMMGHQARSDNNEYSDYEVKLIKTLWNGPVDKWEVIDKLYLGISDSGVAENRFKNLASRFRKKHKGVLQCQQGQYFLDKKMMEHYI